MNMKTTMKKIAALIAALAIAAGSVLSAVACSTGDNVTDESSTPAESVESTPAESEDDSSTTELPDFDYMAEDLTKYVILGQYKDLNIELSPMVVIDDELVMDQINYDLIASEIYNTVTDRAVTKDDIVKISFKGYIDGELMETGTGSKDMVTVFDDGGLIDGFTDGLVGAMPCVEFALDLTFPEEYYDSSIAGKPATFMVTVDHIYEAKELTDEVATELTGGEIKTADELRADYKTRMEESVISSYEEYKLDCVWSQIFNNAELIELPEDVVKSYYQVDVDYYTTYATMYGISYEEILSLIGMTDDEIYARAHDNVLTDMIVYSIVKAEGATLTEEEYEFYLDQVAESSGYGKDAIVAAYGREALEDMFIYTKVYEGAINWQTFTVVEAE